METKNAMQIVEAVLFASGEPVPIQRLCQVLQMNQSQMKQVLERLQQDYQRRSSGIQLVMLEDRCQLYVFRLAVYFAEHPHFVEHRHYGSVNFSFFRAEEQADGQPTL